MQGTRRPSRRHSDGPPARDALDDSEDHFCHPEDHLCGGLQYPVDDKDRPRGAGHGEIRPRFSLCQGCLPAAGELGIVFVGLEDHRGPLADEIAEMACLIGGSVHGDIGIPEETREEGPALVRRIDLPQQPGCSRIVILIDEMPAIVDGTVDCEFSQRVAMMLGATSATARR